MQELKKMLILGHVWPEPGSSAAGTRMLQLISLFREYGYTVTFATAALKSGFSIDLKAIGVDECSILLNDSGFDNWLRNLSPDVVLFDRFMLEEQYGWRVSLVCPAALRILDTEDLHFLRRARQEAHKQGRELLPDDLYTETAKREIAAIWRCDLSLIISQVEMALLSDQFGVDASLLYYLPFLEERVGASDIDGWRSYEERKDFVFIGNFLHAPNWQAVLRLKTQIWPNLRMRLPGISVVVYGAYPSDKVWQLHRPNEGFLVLGRASDARQAIADKRVLLAPLSYGAGLKGKFLDAMHTGTPVVTTTVGAEGMQGDMEWGGFIADEDNDFIEKAVKLYQEPAVWLKAQAAGTAILNERYAKEAHALDFMKQVTHLLGHLSAYRRQNFIGQVLQYHSLQSTKYMSMWIEEKNKLR